MEKIKVLHCADLHLEAKYSFLKEKAKSQLMQSEQLLKFEKIISLCLTEQVELLIIAGDLFDCLNISEQTLNLTVNAFSKIPNTVVAVCAGNHDPLCGTHPLQNIKLPENVILFDTEPTSVFIEQKNLTLFSQSFKGVYFDSANPLYSFKPNPNTVNIALLHADLSASADSVYNPITLSDIELSQMDYIALGHIHKATDILKAGNTYYAYSGCTQGVGFDETDQKGVYLGYIGKNYCDLKFTPITGRVFSTVFSDVTGLTSDSLILEKIKADIIKKHPQSSGDNLYKVTLTGSPDFEPNLAYLTAALSNDYFFIKIKNQTKGGVDLNELKAQNTLKGIFVKKLLEQKSANPDNSEILDLALKLTLSAFNGEVKELDD